MRTTYDFTDEPRDADLRALIRWCGAEAAVAQLVLRDRLGQGARVAELLSRLAAAAVNRRRADAWPGTQLIGETAELVTVALTPAVTEVLAAAATGLYDWRQPELPEDLAFLRADGSVLLATIAHERDAFMELAPHEAARAFDAVPWLRGHARPREYAR